MMFFAPAKNRFRSFMSRYRLHPSFIIIGAMKCGTTSLFKYLERHPCIEGPDKKEIHYFDLHFDRGKKWYLKHFPPLLRRYKSLLSGGGGVITGEASPYYMFYPHAAGRIKALLPRVKLIVLLRNPVDRAFSHYYHEIRHGRETLSFREAIDAEPERLEGEIDRILSDEHYVSFSYGHHSYLARGIYVDQLKRWRELFSGDQMLILNSEEFFASPEKTYGKVVSFLKLPEWKPQSYKKHNPGTYREEMPPEMRERLVEYFKPHNQRLYQYLGFSFDWDH